MKTKFFACLLLLCLAGPALFARVNVSVNFGMLAPYFMPAFQERVVQERVVIVERPCFPQTVIVQPRYHRCYPCYPAGVYYYPHCPYFPY